MPRAAAMHLPLSWHAAPGSALKRTKNGHSARAATVSMGPSALDRWAAAGRSYPCTPRPLSPRWRGGSREQMTGESVCSAAKARSRQPSASDCCLVSEARLGGACVDSSAQQRFIDRGRSDPCSERQHGSCLRFPSLFCCFLVTKSNATGRDQHGGCSHHPSHSSSPDLVVPLYASWIEGVLVFAACRSPWGVVPGNTLLSRSGLPPVCLSASLSPCCRSSSSSGARGVNCEKVGWGKEQSGGNTDLDYGRGSQAAAMTEWWGL